MSVLVSVLTTAQHYQARVKAGQIAYDSVQAALADTLDMLRADMLGATLTKPASLLQTINLFQKIKKPAPPKGIYIYGDVGRGKSMLMDMFFTSLADTKIKKRQVHFHIFMQEAHALLQDIRQQKKQIQDPLAAVARRIAKKAQLICFDEFQVQDIADASILGRLFECLWDNHVVIIATSNRPPDDLYEGGLNRHRFLPFIDLLKTKMQVVALEARQDYRLATLRAAPVWFTPDRSNIETALDERLKALIGDMPLTPTTLTIGGRYWDVPSAAGVARLSFAQLCGTAKGAADYWALAQTFHTILIDNIPRLTQDNRNEVVRFIALIDALYEHRVKLIAQAATLPEQIYAAGDSPIMGSFRFEFARTISRLHEMQSVDYLGLAHIMVASPPPDETPDEAPE